ncbi:MAG: hypothetical protein OJF51_001054 [Nitrospira sp.]|jgi:hypothetical protein|nr:MAG: hypothetical protein OJF51_001054 [Nitrospira sp.]
MPYGIDGHHHDSSIKMDDTVSLLMSFDEALNLKRGLLEAPSSYLAQRPHIRCYDRSRND